MKDTQVKSKKRSNGIIIAAITFVVAVIVAIGVYFVVSLASFGFDVGLWCADRVANKYLTALKNTDYRSAFSCLYLYEEDTDSPYTGSKNDGYEQWRSRVDAYTKIDIYLLKYQTLTVTRDEDGNISGTVVITIYQQGKESTYQTDIVFVGKENTWKIADITAETVKSFYEAAVSGDMSYTE